MLYSQTKIADGVNGYFIKNNRFNTTYISVNFFLPIYRSEQAKRVILPYILTACSEKYDGYIEINKALAELYGADIYASTSKIGNCVCIKLALSTINDRFALDGISPVQKTVDMLMSLIFNPKVSNGSFSEKNLLIEKRKTEEQILGEINDKRAYALSRLLSEMFSDTDYGVERYGTVDTVNAITGETLYNAYSEMLKTAYVTVNVIGEELPGGLFEKIGECFNSVKRENITDVTSVSTLVPKLEVKNVVDYQNVTQAKLSMGFSIDNNFSQNDVALFSDIFGGGPYSKLFSEVREKLSLCYYCGANTNYTKGFLTVNSGVEAPNIDKAQSEILNQLENVKKGNFGDFESEASKKSLKDICKTYSDSQTQLDRWYTVRVITNDFISPEEYGKGFDNITKEKICEIANTVHLDTVYKLLPQEENV